VKHVYTNTFEIVSPKNAVSLMYQKGRIPMKKYCLFLAGCLFLGGPAMAEQNKDWEEITAKITEALAKMHMNHKMDKHDDSEQIDQVKAIIDGKDEKSQSLHDEYQACGTLKIEEQDTCREDVIDRMLAKVSDKTEGGVTSRSAAENMNEITLKSDTAFKKCKGSTCGDSGSGQRGLSGKR
jgi:hypothetical protein